MGEPPFYSTEIIRSLRVFFLRSYSIGSGTFVSLSPVPAVALGPMEDIGRRTGLLMTVLSFGALAGPPISGAVNDTTNGFSAVGIYAGQCNSA